MLAPALKIQRFRRRLSPVDIHGRVGERTDWIVEIVRGLRHGGGGVVDR